MFGRNGVSGLPLSVIAVTTWQSLFGWLLVQSGNAAESPQASVLPSLAEGSRVGFPARTASWTGDDDADYHNFLVQR